HPGNGLPAAVRCKAQPHRDPPRFPFEVVMVKQLVFENDAREAVLRGITKDGVTVAEEIELEDAYENMGAKLVKEAASKTSDVAGDGTTTATLLAHAIFKEGYRSLTAGADAMAIARGIRAAVAAVSEAIKAQSKEINGKADVANVAAISANNDRAIGDIMADAMEK